MSKEKRSLKKIVYNFFKALLIIIVIYNTIYLASTTYLKNDNKTTSIMPYRFFTPKDDLMNDISKKDLIILKNKPKKEEDIDIEVKDIVLIKNKKNNNENELFRVYNVVGENNNKRYIVKKDKGYYLQETEYLNSDIVSLEPRNIKNAGWIIKIVRSNIITILAIIYIILRISFLIFHKTLNKDRKTNKEKRNISR